MPMAASHNELARHGKSRASVSLPLLETLEEVEMFLYIQEKGREFSNIQKLVLDATRHPKASP